jgi:hypothetical protein
LSMLTAVSQTSFVLRQGRLRVWKWLLRRGPTRVQRRSGFQSAVHTAAPPLAPRRRRGPARVTGAGGRQASSCSVPLLTRRSCMSGCCCFSAAPAGHEYDVSGVFATNPREAPGAGERPGQRRLCFGALRQRGSWAAAPCRDDGGRVAHGCCSLQRLSSSSDLTLSPDHCQPSGWHPTVFQNPCSTVPRVDIHG